MMMDMDMDPISSQMMAAQITRAASKQTYYTIRFLTDRDRVSDAYRAYGYFRWVDDCLDSETVPRSERVAFLKRQQSLLDACYHGAAQDILDAEEQMLVDLVSNDVEKNSGLQSYLRNMMAVMAFDVERRGRLILRAELSTYSQLLATAVTDALLYCIGHSCPSPCGETRYLAVRGAHIVHMLRDMQEDAAIGYFNIPRETIEAHTLSFQQVDHPAYRQWVRARVELTSLYFKMGREYLAQVKSLRCRLAGFAYIARFEWIAYRIARDGYRLRSNYPERKSLAAMFWMVGKTLWSLFGRHRPTFAAHERAVQSIEYEES